MRKELKRYIFRKFLLSIFLVAIFFGINFFYLKNKVIDSANQLREKRGILESYKARDEVLAKLSSDYNQVKDEKDKFFNLLPSQEQIINFVSELEAIAAKTGNQQTLTLSDKTVEERGFKVLPFIINLTGSEEQLRNYLASLDKLAYYLVIDAIDYSWSEKEDKITTTIKAKLFVSN